MSETFELPVLPLADEVVLPGMVAPILLDAEAQATVDAAVSAADSRLLLVPRLKGAYGADGLLAVIEQVGRLPGGEPAAVVRGLQRARIGAGVTGAGAALWVRPRPSRRPPPPTARVSLRRPTRQSSCRSCSSGVRGRSSTTCSG